MSLATSAQSNSTVLAESKTSANNPATDICDLPSETAMSSVATTPSNSEMDEPLHTKFTSSPLPAVYNESGDIGARKCASLATTEPARASTFAVNTSDDHCDIEGLNQATQRKEHAGQKVNHAHDSRVKHEEENSTNKCINATKARVATSSSRNPKENKPATRTPKQRAVQQDQQGSLPEKAVVPSKSTALEKNQRSRTDAGPSKASHHGTGSKKQLSRKEQVKASSTKMNPSAKTNERGETQNGEDQQSRVEATAVGDPVTTATTDVINDTHEESSVRAPALPMEILSQKSTGDGQKSKPTTTTTQKTTAFTEAAETIKNIETLAHSSSGSEKINSELHSIECKIEDSTWQTVSPVMTSADSPGGTGMRGGSSSFESISPESPVIQEAEVVATICPVHVEKQEEAPDTEIQYSCRPTRRDCSAQVLYQVTDYVYFEVVQSTMLGCEVFLPVVHLTPEGITLFDRCQEKLSTYRDVAFERIKDQITLYDRQIAKIILPFVASTASPTTIRKFDEECQSTIAFVIENGKLFYGFVEHEVSLFINAVCCSERVQVALDIVGRQLAFCGNSSSNKDAWHSRVWKMMSEKALDSWKTLSGFLTAVSWIRLVEEVEDVHRLVTEKTKETCTVLGVLGSTVRRHAEFLLSDVDLEQIRKTCHLMYRTVGGIVASLRTNVSYYARQFHIEDWAKKMFVEMDKRINLRQHAENLRDNKVAISSKIREIIPSFATAPIIYLVNICFSALALICSIPGEDLTTRNTSAFVSPICEDTQE